MAELTADGVSPIAEAALVRCSRSATATKMVSCSKVMMQSFEFTE
ncbi:hypothetical protein FHS26_003214 [Rhizobium pisi]|uniref:Uncharacterized protein n=1 Tax=Rhizobium pisi TaxID=574561 RepID=A0A7W5G037_9HYPH|nr:hypothetical protein [Rhizobium pisi]